MDHQIEHCVKSDGSQCTSCCQVLTLAADKRTYLSWSRYIGPEVKRIREILVPISKRRAKKINRAMVKQVGDAMTYYKCKKLTDKGCGDYKRRPKMCRDYPYYGRTKKQVKESGETCHYDDECTFYISL